MKALDKNFKPFTLVHEEKDQFCHFEPTDNPDVISVRFKGACGRIVETTSPVKEAMFHMAHLYGLGYVEQESPIGEKPENP